MGAAGGGGRGQHLRGQDPGAAAQPRHADLQGEQQPHNTALRPSYHVHPASGCSPGPAWRWPRGSCWRTAATSTASPSGSRGSRRPAPTSAWSSTKVRPSTWRLPPVPLYPDTPLTHAAARVRVLPRPPAPPPARARQLPALTTALAVLGSTALLLLLVLLALLCRHRARTKLGEVQYIHSCHI